MLTAITHKFFIHCLHFKHPVVYRIRAAFSTLELFINRVNLTRCAIDGRQ